MRTLRPTIVIVLLLAMVAGLAALQPGPQAGANAEPPEVAEAGYDLLETDRDNTFLDVVLPADFFGPGSDPFVGTVYFEGVDIPDYTPPGGLTYTELGPTSTIVERKQDAGDDGYPETIEIEIVELALVSTAPITVTYNGGQDPEDWDITAEVPENDVNQTPGSMEVSWTDEKGGTFDASLPVDPLLTFTGPGVIGPFYYSVMTGGIIEFEVLGVPWSYTANPLIPPTGHWVIEKEGLTSNLFPGIARGPTDERIRDYFALVDPTIVASHSVQAAAQLETNYKCYDIIPDDVPLGIPATLETQFGIEEVMIDTPAHLCPPALKNGMGDELAPHLKCYDIVAMDPLHVVNLETQFGLEEYVEVGEGRLLCMPAAKTVLEPIYEPPGPLEPSPHYECFEITGPPPGFVVDLWTQFGDELGVTVDNAHYLCAPAIKYWEFGPPEGEGDLNAPHLKCYDIVGPAPEHPSFPGIPYMVELETQFGFEVGFVDVARLLCIPAAKTVLYASVGDWVWQDLDGNGIQDGGEPGYGGATVELWDGAQTTLLNTTVTAGDGSYAFTGLLPGSYSVKFIVPSVNYVFSPQDVGGDDTVDSDANPATGFTASFSLIAGQNDTSWDAGLMLGPGPGPVFSTSDLGTGSHDITPNFNALGLDCTSSAVMSAPGTSMGGPCAARVPGAPAGPVPDAMTLAWFDLGLDLGGPFFDDLDAISLMEPVNTGPVDYDFSVDAAPPNGGNTVGIPGLFPPDVATEAAALEAQGDIFNTGSAAPPPFNTQITDEAALGLIAPNPNWPMPGIPPLDEVNALTDATMMPAPGPCTVGAGTIPITCPGFSLTNNPSSGGGILATGMIPPDADPLVGMQAEEGSILVPPSAPPIPPALPVNCAAYGGGFGVPCIAVNAAHLGLMARGGPIGTNDDIDALCWFDGNGNSLPDIPNSWIPGGGDYYIFSLTPGSPSVGGGFYSAADLLIPDAVNPGGPPRILQPSAALGLGWFDNVDGLICRDDDTDLDGAPDQLDNCWNDFNPMQADTDGDYVGDACDTGDSDGDFFPDEDEFYCGSPVGNGTLVPERIGNGTDDDGDIAIDEVQAPVPGHDCDGDGFDDDIETGLTWPGQNGPTAETVGANECDDWLDDDLDGVVNDGCPNPVPGNTYNGTGNQERCADVAGSQNENDDQWPADFNDDGKLNLQDVGSFNAPIKHYLGTPLADHARWNLAGGTTINLQDVNLLNTLKPPMFNGLRAYGNTMYGTAGTCPAD